MSATIGIREGTDADIGQILAVLRRALGETPLLRRTPELFRWKHHDNPFGRSVVLVAESGDRVVGVRAMMRWELRTRGGEMVRCLRPVDTATDPEYTRRGIFRNLTMSALEIARTEGVQLVFNTPNPRSAPGYLDMGWAEVGWIGGLVRPRFGPAAHPKTDPPPPDDLVADVEAFVPTPRADRPPLGLRTARSPQYWEWRFNRHPTARYGWVAQPGGDGGAVVRAAVRRGRSETSISDLLGGFAGEAVRRVVARSRARYVATWFSPGTPERRAAIRAGLLPVPGLRTLRLLALPLTPLDLEVHRMESWDLATSDLELL